MLYCYKRFALFVVSNSLDFLMQQPFGCQKEVRCCGFSVRSTSISYNVIWPEEKASLCFDEAYHSFQVTQTRGRVQPSSLYTDPSSGTGLVCISQSQGQGEYINSLVALDRYFAILIFFCPTFQQLQIPISFK